MEYVLGRLENKVTAVQGMIFISTLVGWVVATVVQGDHLPVFCLVHGSGELLMAFDSFVMEWETRDIPNPPYWAFSVRGTVTHHPAVSRFVSARCAALN